MTFSSRLSPQFTDVPSSRPPLRSTSHSSLLIVSYNSLDELDGILGHIR